MADPLASVSRGDPLRIGADTWNAVIDATRRVKVGRPDQRAAGGTWGTIEALAINSTGADLREYKPCTVTAAGGHELDDDTSAGDWLRRPLLTLGVPAAATDWVVVTLEAIPDGAIGRVAVSGVCLCDIASASGSTRWGKATVGSTASLTASDTSGTVRVLHVPATGTPKRCAVYLHERPGPGEGCGIVPTMRRRVTGVDFAGEQVRYVIEIVDENGCETVSGPFCGDGATCSETDDTVYYCISGVCWAVYDGLVPDTFDAGPFATPELCGAGCPVTPPATVDTACCPDPVVVLLNFGSTTGMDADFTWDGTSGTTGVVAVGGGAGTFNLTLTCSGVDETGLVFGSGVGADYTVAFNALSYVQSCDPFSVQADGLLTGMGPRNGEAITFTVVPA